MLPFSGRGTLLRLGFLVLGDELTLLPTGVSRVKSYDDKRRCLAGVVASAKVGGLSGSTTTTRCGVRSLTAWRLLSFCAPTCPSHINAATPEMAGGSCPIIIHSLLFTPLLAPGRPEPDILWPRILIPDQLSAPADKRRHGVLNHRTQQPVWRLSWRCKIGRRLDQSLTAHLASRSQVRCTYNNMHVGPQLGGQKRLPVLTNPI